MQNRSVDLYRPLLEPNELYLRHEQCFALLNAWPRYYVQNTPCQEKEGRTNFDITLLPDIQIDTKLKDPLCNIRQFINDFDGRILFSVESVGRQQSLLELLAPLKIKPAQCRPFIGFY